MSAANLPANAKKGSLVPLITAAQRTSISAAAQRLLANDTSLNQFWFFDGSQWTAISDDRSMNSIPRMPYA